MNKIRQGQDRYLLVDSGYIPLARAVLESPASGEIWQMQVLDGKIEDLLEREVLQLVSMRDGEPAMMGRVIRHHGDRIAIERLQKLSEDLRQNLRLPVNFSSFIYPLSGSWTGRRPVQSYDLSCGGIAFFISGRLESREQVEIVIPITEEPLLVRSQVLRAVPSSGPDQLYAAKFVDLCEGEEKLIREAVFSAQLNRDGKTT